VAYAGSDLLCYRADSPARLAARQSAEWDPPLAWAAQRFGARFVCVAGVVHHPQSEMVLAVIAEYVRALDEFRLAALHNITTITGSAILAVALIEGAMTADAAWAAAHVDEDWQIEQWGRDAEANARRAAREREFRAAVRLVELLGA
jgi:chaperone required for assembly of F1-ATPase